MDAITLKLPPQLHATLEKAAQKAQLSKSEWVRRALSAQLSQAEVADRRDFVSALDAAGDLVGCFKGSRATPRDLASNPKHLAGFGSV